MADYYQILANGEILQQEFVNGWKDISARRELNKTNNYRIKPKPEVIYCNKLKGVRNTSAGYDSREYALKAANEREDTEDFEYIAKCFTADE